jgi:hypothetical protein
MTPTKASWIRTQMARCVLPLVCCAFLLSACVQQQAALDDPQDIAPNADKILKGACDYLAKSPQFSCSVEAWDDIVLAGTGHKIQLSRTVDVKVRRPDRLWAEMNAKGSKSIYYNGKTVTVFNHTENVWGEVAAPNTLDQTLDVASDQYGMDMPLQDILVSDPYANATEDVRIGRDLGMDVALGTQCHHLGFAQDTIDWQIWIEDGAKPLIRKLVITYKKEEGSPQFTALFSKWDMATPIPESAFAFTVPAGAGKMDILPRVKEPSQK